MISDCVTSYDLKKMDEMLKCYADKGCEVLTLEECMRLKPLRLRNETAG